MEFVSGEICYQAKLSRGLDSDEKLRPLFTFLESDLDSKIQKTQSRIALDRLKNLRRLNSTFYDAAIAHDSTTLQQYFDVLCRSALHEATYHGRRMTVEVAQLQESIDTELMERVLQYFSILKDELNTTCERLDEHSVNCTRKKHHAKRLRDIQIFSKHLEVETQGIVTCDLIPAGSSQWTRCGKAIKDNLCIPRLQRYNLSTLTLKCTCVIYYRYIANKN